MRSKMLTTQTAQVFQDSADSVALLGNIGLMTIILCAAAYAYSVYKNSKNAKAY